MPILSMFYGIIIRMYYEDHQPPHFHAYYGDYEAVFDFSGELIQGEMPKKQQKLIDAWCVIHSDELIANWKLSQENESVFKIEPLK